MENDEVAAAEIEARRVAGNQGKLWRIETRYEVDKEKRVLYTENLYTKEMKAFRENVFSIGLMVPFGPSVWRIIPPFSIGDIYITLQGKYFEP